MAQDPAQLSVEFGRRLAAVRIAAGLSQRELARSLGHEGPDAVSRYERGMREPRLSAIMELAAALGVSVEDLLPEYGTRAVNPATDALDQLSRRLQRVARTRPEGAEAALRAATAVLDVLEPR